MTRPKRKHFLLLLLLSSVCTMGYLVAIKGFEGTIAMFSSLTYEDPSSSSSDWSPTRTYIRRNGTLALLVKPWNCSHCFSWTYQPVLDQRNACVALAPNHTIDLIFLIPSTHDNRAQRDSIRCTWGSVAGSNNNTGNFRRMFFIGRTADAVRMREVEEESRHFRDVVVLGFEDTYRNLTLKTLMMLQWLTERCSNARFFLKVDDDMWVNTEALMSKVIPAEGDLSRGVGGFCNMHPEVIRNGRNKWSATRAEYPADSYPRYCSGTAYVSTVRVARRIVSVSRDIPFFHLEDVFIGLCLRQLGMRVVNLPGFNMGVPRAVRKDGCRSWGSDVVTVHRVSAHSLLQFWSCRHK